MTESEPKPKVYSRSRSGNPQNRLGDDMQKHQNQVAEILKIEDPIKRRLALKEYARQSKSAFSEEPDTEILNLSLMQPKCQPSFQPKPKKSQEPKPEQSVPLRAPQKAIAKKLKDSIYFKTDEEYEAYLNETLEKEGLFQELYDQLKVLYISRKNIPALMSVWEHLDQLGMDTYQACLEQAEILIQMEEMQKAFVFLDRAVRLDPENLKGIRAIALYHKLNREYELAIHWLEKWKKINMEDAEVYYHMGSVYRRTGMMEMALTELRRCLHLNNNHLMARSLLTKMGY